MIIKGKKIKVYNYNDVLVFLAFEDDVKGVKPLDTDGNIGAYPIECYDGSTVCCTTEEVYSGEWVDEVEIVCCECVSPENDQSLLIGWWSIDYAINDEFERTFLVTTDRYYDWTSERTKMLEKLSIASVDDVVTREVYTKLKLEWDNMVSRFCQEHVVLFSAPFDELFVESRLLIE